ncbi:hypothetical protein PR048_011238 [Dryococelus australis]|uniref:Uncharacterized protein n=1 Tax=Dryococelus australis TaxID=614101 RepID=A0ABQ9HL21_9NEOP|nr:hypothetical protein PR048_011238 [Dryococelus australis]
MARQSESVSQYIMELKNCAKMCNFGYFLDNPLHDCLVCGLSSYLIQMMLFIEPNLIFEMACTIALSMELAAYQTKLCSQLH